MSEYIYGADEHEGHWLTGEEIVRCRDCRHYHEGVCYRPDGDGDYARWAVEPYGFCAWGERRQA